MALTQESVLSALMAEGGKAKKSDLVERFKGVVDCGDPAQRARNRELFKTFVNNVAFVTDVDGVRYVVVKRTYRRLPETGGTAAPLTGERRQRPPQTGRSAEQDPELAGESGENPCELLSPTELALRRSKYTGVRVRRTMRFGVLEPDADGGRGCSKGAAAEPSAMPSKPYGLPLRVPPGATGVEVHRLKAGPLDPPGPDEVAMAEPSKSGRKPSPEEAKDTRDSSTAPLELLEHEWLVKCASGLWSQVYGLLLRDGQLAKKRDFISGFTVLHWAAKCGNSDMLVKVMDVSRQRGVDLDINARTHGGYTPLHVAALHKQECIMAMLVGEYGADVGVRDNCGKKACHYLSKGTSDTLRGMLAGRPRTRQPDDRGPREKEELGPIPDLHKGRHSISRLFQPHATGQKKKDKQRPGFYSMSSDPDEDKSGSVRRRVLSDAFV